MKQLSQEVKDFIQGVEGIVEANSFESMCLWEKYQKDWVSNPLGHGVQMGTVDGLPVMISIRTSVVRGKKILFWYATSQMVDYRMVEAWIKEHLPGVPKTDASNFHTIL